LNFRELSNGELPDADKARRIAANIAAIASPLCVPNRTKENDEAARKQNDECKSIVCHLMSR